MANDALAFVLNDGIKSIAGLHVGEVRPCPEDFERPQLSTVLMRNDVVRIIRTGAEVLKSSENFPRQLLSGYRAIGSIGTPLRAAEHLFQVARLHGTFFSGGHANSGFGVNLQVFSP